VVVINAASGRQEGEAIAGLIRDALSAAGLQGSIRLVSHAEEIPGVAEQAARQARERHGILVGVGGRRNAQCRGRGGHEGWSGVFGGAGRHLQLFWSQPRLPEEPRAAIHSLLQGELRPIQVGQVNGTSFW
jgi:diacylglycerol kinase family enzyme